MLTRGGKTRRVRPGGDLLSVKIRLARAGAKKAPFYRIVVADSRSPRDGRFIEIIGRYNPRTQPSTVVLDVEKAKAWLGKGAEITETAAKLLKIAELPADSVAPTSAKETKPSKKVQAKAAADVKEKADAKAKAEADKKASAAAAAEAAAAPAEEPAAEEPAAEDEAPADGSDAE
jgi:small subunit ribosomal protein S16